MYKNKIKITGGILKGSYIEILDKKSQVKPTKSYIREVIFNTVLSVKNFHCLDLFSGSGILSAEAISRGADEITLIEKDKNNCKTIKKEFSRLKIEKYNLIQTDALEFLNKDCQIRYDLIFLDPPYGTDILNKSLTLLETKGYLKNSSYLFFEQHKKEQKKRESSFMDTDWIILKDLSIGEVSYTIAKKRI